MRIVRLAKAQNITSIADFIAARYGKAQTVAATVALIAIIGIDSLHRAATQGGVVIARRPSSPSEAGSDAIEPILGDVSLFVALAWRPSPCCSAPAISMRPSIRTG